MPIPPVDSKLAKRKPAIPCAPMDCRLFTHIKVGDLVGKTAVFGKEAVLRKINITKKFEKARKKHLNPKI